LNEVMLDVMDWQERFELDLPKTLIDKETYPNAPEEVLGLPLPIVYGDFRTINDVANQNTYPHKNYCVPIICIDSTTPKFCIAGHVCHTVYNELILQSSNMSDFGRVRFENPAGTLNDPSATADDGGLAMISFSPGLIIISILCFALRTGTNNEGDLTVLQNTNPSDEVDLLYNATEILSFHIGDLPPGTLNANFSGRHLFLIWGKNNIGFKSKYAAAGSSSLTTIATHAAPTEFNSADMSSVLDGMKTSDVQRIEFAISTEESGQGVDVYNAFLLLIINADDQKYSFIPRKRKAQRARTEGSTRDTGGDRR
jgi:hypothetical protein